MRGYHGRALVVDLDPLVARYEELPDEVLRRFVGGVGLAAYLLHRFAPPQVDPLSPANPLTFVASPLVGTRLTTSAKYAVVAKSPLTGFIGDSISSSHLAMALKGTGADAVVLRGAAPWWSFLLVEETGVRLYPAEELLGLTTTETEAAVRTRLGDAKLRLAAIGPAGERLVRFASLASDGRLAGRTGLGAVMGSKRLKAVAFRGAAAPSVAHPEELARYARDLAARSLGPATEKYRTLGTAANVSVFNRLGVLPTRNFAEGSFAGAARLSGEELFAHYKVRSLHCAHCTIGCEHVFRTAASEGRAEYETLFALGPACGVDDPEVVLAAARLCDELGMDSISAGVTVAWAMECAERGLLPEAPRFGDGAGLLRLLGQVGTRQGLGDLLAEGTRRAAALVGSSSEGWAMHVKGLEMPGYEPRRLHTLALGLAVSTRGACHNRSSAYEADFAPGGPPANPAAAAAASEDHAALLDSLILCKFLRKAFPDLPSEAALMLRLITGEEWTRAEMVRLGERVTNLKKAYNIREGWSRADDTLPARILEEPVAGNGHREARLSRAQLDAMIDEYYRVRRWNPDGTIPPETVRALSLDDVVVEPAGSRP